MKYLKSVIATQRVGNPDIELFKHSVDVNLTNIFEVPREETVYERCKINPMRSQLLKHTHSTTRKDTNE